MTETTYNNLLEQLEALANLAIETLDTQKKYFKAKYGSKEKDDLLKRCKNNLEPALRRTAKESLELLKDIKSPTLDF